MGDFFKSKPATQTTTSAPWAPTQPHLKNILASGEDLYNANPNPGFFPGQTFAESDFRNQAAQGIADTATAPGGLISNAQQSVGNILNPNMDAIGDAVRAQVIPQVTSQFQAAGRQGSALEQEAIGTGVARALAPYALQGQAQQLQAASMAPGLATAGYDQLNRAGVLSEDLQQRGINEDIARFDHTQNAPWQQLGRYSDLVRGQASLGGTNTATKTEAQASPFQTALGLGLGVGGLFL